jgi:small subunit ribosomal protein S6
LRLYETTFITDAQMPEAEIEAEIRRVEDLIRANGGELIETQRWGVRRLAYDIEKKRQGYYAHFLYKAQTGVPALVDAQFHVNERIMRHLTVVSEVDLEARARELAEGGYRGSSAAPDVAAAIPAPKATTEEPESEENE